MVMVETRRSAAAALFYAAALAMVSVLGLASMGVQRGPAAAFELASVGGGRMKTPQAANLAANLARWRAKHPPVFKAAEQPALAPKQHKLQQLSQTPPKAAPAQMRAVSGLVPLPPGVVLRALQPGQKLPEGAVVVNVPQLAQAASAPAVPASAAAVHSGGAV
eukprot:CAMPEP_0206254112 /NCGR_PEP_ID=MMETSP0047_2-20121206/23520_1 /ASSEMBLY_ACC=CAM_ASM_000192 /TAXON_ID=195065 /ORGANISM="Chroomonas mesostigmatica_cf, Strain CCMP1168" /LENGTH=162 /DNA_ID=CAMNT_0053680383 /DNA_START=78 /DNA_END=563 /DNA_ORIENTATION=+